MKIWVRIIFLENKWPDLTQRAVENSWINIEVWNKLKWLSNNYFQKWKGPDGLDSLPNRPGPAVSVPLTPSEGKEEWKLPALFHKVRAASIQRPTKRKFSDISFSNRDWKFPNKILAKNNRIWTGIIQTWAITKPQQDATSRHQDGYEKIHGE